MSTNPAAAAITEALDWKPSKARALVGRLVTKGILFSPAVCATCGKHLSSPDLGDTHGTQFGLPISDPHAVLVCRNDLPPGAQPIETKLIPGEWAQS